MIFVPSVGPGYADTRIRPWNSKNTASRREGGYYEAGWRAAISANPRLVSITSFNEWGEGTQVEPAIPMAYSNYTYDDYAPHQPEIYLQLTGHWAWEMGPGGR